MNVMLEHPDAAVPNTLDVPAATRQQATHVGIRVQQPPVQTHQALKYPPRPRPRTTLTQAFRTRMHPPPPPPPPQQQAPREVIQTFTEFANPVKQRVGTSPSEMSDGSYSSDGDGAPSDGPPSASGDGRDEDDQFEDLAGDYPARAPDDGMMPAAEDPLRPSDGFRTLDDEKTDILCKLNRLKRQGMSGLRTFGVHSDIREMRSELTRVKTELELEASIKFQRKILMALTSTMEYANTRWNPLDLHLQGWSEQICESLTDYDTVFERLFYKYRGKVSMPPEAELLLMVGSSAFVFHLTNTMFKSKNITENPQFMEQMAKMMAAQQQQQQEQQQQQPQQEPQQQPAADDARRDETDRREIRGPAMDFSAFMGGGGGLPPMGMGPPPPRPSVPVADPVAAPMPGARAAPRRGGTKRPASDSGSERLSDIISEDLGSLPDDMSSGDDDDSSTGSERERKLVRVVGGPGAPGRGRGRGRGRGGSTVVMI